MPDPDAPDRSQVGIALLAAAALILGALISGGTSFVNARQQVHADAELGADAGLRAERRQAYSSLVAAEAQVANAEERVFDCLYAPPRSPPPPKAERVPGTATRDAIGTLEARAKRRDQAELDRSVTSLVRGYRAFDRAIARSVMVASTAALDEIFRSQDHHSKLANTLSTLPLLRTVSSSRGPANIEAKFDVTRADLDASYGARAELLSVLREDLGAASAPNDVPTRTADAHTGC